MNIAAICASRVAAGAFHNILPTPEKVAIPCYFQDGEICTDSVNMLSSTGTLADNVDEYVEMTYSWKTKGYFQVSLVLFFVCLVSVGFGIALNDPRLVAVGAVIMSLASASLFVCIRRANKEHERSH